MTIDCGVACVVPQQGLGSFLGHLLRRFAARPEGTEHGSRMLVFRHQKNAGARTSGMHALDAYVDVGTEWGGQRRRAIGHALRYVSRQIGRDRAADNA
jgi:hypothetical protein